MLKLKIPNSSSYGKFRRLETHIMIPVHLRFADTVTWVLLSLERLIGWDQKQLPFFWDNLKKGIWCKVGAIAGWFQLGLVLRSPVLLWSMLRYSYLLSLWKFAIFNLTLGLGNQKLLLRGGKFTICKGIWCLESCIGDLRSWIWGPKPQLGNGGLSCLIESGDLRSEIWEMMVYLTSLMPESGGLSWLLRSLVLFCGLGPSEVLSMTFFEARKICFTPWSLGMEICGSS